MPTEDAYSSGHLVLSHFGTCMCSNVETNLSWTCLVSGPLNFEHPSVLLFCPSGKRSPFCLHECSIIYWSMTLIPTLTLTKLRQVSMEHLLRVWHANRESLPFRIPVSVPLFGLAWASNVETIFLELFCLYSAFHLEYPLVLFRFCIV